MTLPQDELKQLERMRDLDQKMKHAHGQAFKIVSRDDIFARKRGILIGLIILAILVGLLTGLLGIVPENV